MSATPFWIWQQPDCPHFHWHPEVLGGLLTGMTGTVDSHAELDGDAPPTIEPLT